jgi:hypothetical protein
MSLPSDVPIVCSLLRVTMDVFLRRLHSLHSDGKVKVKQFRYTLWRRLGGEEV